MSKNSKPGKTKPSLVTGGATTPKLIKKGASVPAKPKTNPKPKGK